MWGGTKPTARRSLSQPTADSSLYAREPAPLPPNPLPSPAWRGWPRRAGCGGDPYRIKPGLVEWERFFPLIRHALRRATFPVGEGDLRRGRVHRGPAFTFRCPLHTRPGLRPVHPLQAGEGDFPAGVNTLSWERVAGRSPDGCGAAGCRTWYRPSSAATPGWRIPRPLLLGEGAAAAAGVEGTPELFSRGRIDGIASPTA